MNNYFKNVKVFSCILAKMYYFVIIEGLFFFRRIASVFRNIL